VSLVTPGPNAAGIVALLHARYHPPEWALLEELQDSTGAGSSRRFDAVAFNCWPSSKFVRLGFEVKVSRSDFARELEDHKKRAALEAVCHQVFFVVPTGVCVAREIPEPWGLLQVSGEGLRALVKPRHREVGPIPEPLAVCAIRRLMERDLAYQKRHYIFDGAEVTQADIDIRAAAAVEKARAKMDAELAKVQEQQQVLAASRRLVEQDAGRWWEIWRQVADAATGRRSWHPPSPTPPTQEQLIEAIALIRHRGRAELENKLRTTRDTIDAMLSAMAEPAGDSS